MNYKISILVCVLGAASAFYLKYLGKSSTKVPAKLYKITTVDLWAQSKNGDRLVLAELDKSGFIHLAEEQDVERISKKFFPNEKKLAVLELDPKLLVGRIVFETNPGGSQKYYHLYDGYIPIQAISKVIEKNQ